MGDAEKDNPPTKKRGALTEISRDNPGLDEDEDTHEQETGTFKRASEEVLAARRIVKVRRQPTPAAASSNPFAGISLVPPVKANTAAVSTASVEAQIVSQKPFEDEVNSGIAKGVSETESNGKDKQLESKNEGEIVESFESVEKPVPVTESSTNPETTTEKDDGKEKTEKDGEGEGEGDTDPSGSSTPLSSFGGLASSQNAFTGLAGTGFSSSSFPFGSIPTDRSSSGSVSLFGLNSDKPPTFPLLNLGNSTNGSPVFGSTGTSDATSTKGVGGVVPSMPEVPVETGEENEKAVFNADAVLLEYLDGSWKERGKGELKVNISTFVADRARLVMRARGNLRLILNASLFPDMKLANMDKRGITFACINSSTGGEGKNALSTFALKFRDASVVEEFRAIVTTHRGRKTAPLKTPENSPKASDD